MSTTVKVIDFPYLKVTFVLSLVSSASNLLADIETVGMIWSLHDVKPDVFSLVMFVYKRTAYINRFIQKMVKIFNQIVTFPKQLDFNLTRHWTDALVSVNSKHGHLKKHPHDHVPNPEVTGTPSRHSLKVSVIRLFSGPQLRTAIASKLYSNLLFQHSAGVQLYSRTDGVPLLKKAQRRDALFTKVPSSEEIS